MDDSYDVVPAHLVVKAMQDSGYRNAAYAIAELIDNSIQADATMVELLCVEKDELVQKRRRTNVDELAILDNGCGMDEKELRRALQFGNGGHLADREGIGRFGMGLPNSSMSQGDRVAVWSWQKGPANALYSYLDLNEIASGEMKHVPRPKKQSIPKKWLKTGSAFGDSGTLVVWENPNRCTWKTADAIVRNSEQIVGRLYRRFLQSGEVTIRMAAFRETALDAPRIDDVALPNDPLYLMERTSCPAPFSENAMFEPLGEEYRQTIPIQFRGMTHEVVLTYSVAKKEARKGHNPGGKPHGKHAARNLGVSVVRANRELELDRKWMPAYDPTSRWIGIEVDFPPALDEVFGVTNNKQSATHLADFAGVEKGELAEKHGYDSYTALKDAWHQDEDIRQPLLEIKDSIEANVGTLMRLLEAQTRGARGPRRYTRDSPEGKATEATHARQESGHTGASDDDESKLLPEQKKSEVEQGLVDAGVDKDTAVDLAAKTVDHGLKYVFGHADSTGGAFFSVKPKGGALLITLNTSHPAYAHLVAVLEDSQEGLDLDQLRTKHAKALDGLKLLLTAWARFEDEQPDGNRRAAIQDAREDWGRVARQFLEDT